MTCFGLFCRHRLRSTGPSSLLIVVRGGHHATMAIAQPLPRWNETLDDDAAIASAGQCRLCGRRAHPLSRPVSAWPGRACVERRTSDRAHTARRVQPHGSQHYALCAGHDRLHDHPRRDARHGFDGAADRRLGATAMVVVAGIARLCGQAARRMPPLRPRRRLGPAGPCRPAPRRRGRVRSAHPGRRRRGPRTARRLSAVDGPADRQRHARPRTEPLRLCRPLRAGSGPARRLRARGRKLDARSRQGGDSRPPP